MTKSIANKDLIRAINRSAILNAIKDNRPIGRADIARQTGLSPATVTGITAELIASDLIKEVSLGDSSGGRPQILLDLNPAGGFVIGIKLMEDHLISALVDLEASVVAQSQLDFQSKHPNDIVTKIEEAVSRLLSSQDIPPEKLLGLGVGLAGVVNHKEGLVRYSPFFGWKNIHLGSQISAVLNVPVYIDNDVNTFAIAESLFGSAAGENDFIVITIGRGIGLGVMSQGVPFRGATGGAGELGHVIVDENGPLCSCGNRGCLEMFASEPAILETAQDTLKQEVSSIEDLIRMAEKGNQDVQKIFEHAGTLIGTKVAELISIMGPRLVIISGEGIRMGDFLLGPMLKAVDRFVMPALRGTYEVRIEPWGDDAWARGAACLVLNQIFLAPNI